MPVTQPASLRIRKRILFFVFLALGIFPCAWQPPGSLAGMVVQTCFSPAGQCSHHILREILRARREILVAVFAFTNDDIARALVEAKKRGIEVRVVLDREFDRENDFSQGSYLKKKGLSVRRVSGRSKGKQKHGSMHQKFAVIDSRVVFTGSYNWTASADNYNDENLLMFHDAGPLAEDYRRQFLRLWEKGQ